ncbi:MAG: hypothetical protein DMD67_01310 [Gemmatimonadetes bacterium]|nr:MAG: hypothetical protein DMD67_01310 [Gemmatimonadota bacterium]
MGGHHPAVRGGGQGALSGAHRRARSGARGRTRERGRDAHLPRGDPRPFDRDPRRVRRRGGHRAHRATPHEIAEARALEQRRRELASQLEEVVDLPAVTVDGLRIVLRGNVDLPDEISAARQHGAEGVGLLRTEFLITGHSTLPTEDEQAAYFGRVAEAFPGHPVVVRTYDLGGDKLPLQFRAPSEANPQLGWRAIRVCLDRPELFRTQVRAALRAAKHGDVWLMAPLVTRLEELDRTRAL